MNHWAIPGGFFRMDETLEECALREIRGESARIMASDNAIDAKWFDVSCE